MTQQIESGALTLLNEILQLGAGGEPTAVLDDGNVSQVLDIQAVIRRSLTFANSGGLWFFSLQNVHPGADSQTSQQNPYAINGGLNAFPTTMPRGFDVWLLYASMRRTSGAGALTGGGPYLTLPTTMRGKGTDVGAPIVSLGLWDGVEALTGLNFAVTTGGDSILRLGVRLTRGTTIHVRTVSTAAATFQTAVVVAAFPSGLGQDGVT